MEPNDTRLYIALAHMEAMHSLDQHDMPGLYGAIQAICENIMPMHRMAQIHFSLSPEVKEALVSAGFSAIKRVSSPFNQRDFENIKNVLTNAAETCHSVTALINMMRPFLLPEVEEEAKLLLAQAYSPKELTEANELIEEQTSEGAVYENLDLKDAPND